MTKNKQSQNKNNTLQNILSKSIFYILFLFSININSSLAADVNSNGFIDITNYTELSDIRNNLSANYELLNDIDLASTTNWSPIGVVDITNGSTITTATPFSGTLNGNGFKIRNLKVNRGFSYAGLFGSISGNVNNLSIINSNVSSTYFAGILSGNATGSNATLTNIFVQGTSTASIDFAGGIIGWAQYLDINNSSSSVSVNGGNGVGGLIGVLNAGSINNTNSNGVVIGKNGVGGLVGSQYGDINNSFSSSSVTGATSTGGLVGEQYAIINNSYAMGNVIGLERVGGLVGEQYDDTMNSYAEGNVTGGVFAGGVVGLYHIGENVNNYFYNNQIQKRLNVAQINRYDSENTIATSSSVIINNQSQSGGYNMGDNLSISVSNNNASETVSYNWQRYDNIQKRFIDINNTNANNYTLTANDVSANNIFRVRINNKNNTSQNGNYIYSQSINTTSLTNPTNLSVNNITSTSSTLSWGVVNNATGYNINLNSSVTQFSPLGATTTASSQYDVQYGATQAFNIESASIAPVAWITMKTGGNATGWAQIQYANPKILTKYEIVTRGDCCEDQMAKSWTLQGSNNGTNWVILDTQFEQTGWVKPNNNGIWETGEKKTYNISNTNSYNYYRINLTASVSSLSITSIGSIHLFGISELSTTSASTTYNFSNLLPETNYTASVQAYNSNGVSDIVTTSFATLAAPISTTTITGFQYSSSTVIYGDIAPTLTQGITNSNGARSYNTNDNTICTTDVNTGAVTLLKVGLCVINQSIATSTPYTYYSTSTSINIIRRALSIASPVLSTTSKIYDGNTNYNTNITIGNLSNVRDGYRLGTTLFATSTLDSPNAGDKVINISYTLTNGVSSGGGKISTSAHPSCSNAPTNTKSCLLQRVGLSLWALGSSFDGGNSFFGFQIYNSPQEVQAIGPFTADQAVSLAIPLTGDIATNYILNNSTTTFTITKKPLTITPDNITITQGDTPIFTSTTTGFISGENIANAAGYIAPTCNASGATSVGTHTISCSGGSATNYSFNYATATLNINNPAPSTHSISGSISYYASSTKPIVGAQISLTNTDNNTLVSTTTTNNTGTYTFNNVSTGGNYKLSATYTTSSSTTGININDNVRNAQIIVGTYTPTDDAKISADTNQDGIININDNVRNAQIIVGTYALPIPFIFIPTDKTNLNATSTENGITKKNYLWPSYQSKTINNLNSNQIINFKGYKIGDSNGDWR